MKRHQWDIRVDLRKNLDVWTDGCPPENQMDSSDFSELGRHMSWLFGFSSYEHLDFAMKSEELSKQMDLLNGVHGHTIYKMLVLRRLNE